MKQTIYSVLAGLILMVFVTGCETTKELVLSGSLVLHSECKSGARAANQIADKPDSLSCIEYYFDASSNKLNLNHINAGFNCCPDSLYCNITSSKDTIIIQEFEESFLCNCNCLYDLQIEVNGVKEGKYQIKFIEPYAGGMEPIVFEIDLKKETEGGFCIVRKSYPWGM
jgi:hypothetical protein